MGYRGPRTTKMVIVLLAHIVQFVRHQQSFLKGSFTRASLKKWTYDITFSDLRKSLQSAKSISFTPGLRTIEDIGRLWRESVHRQHP